MKCSLLVPFSTFVLNAFASEDGLIVQTTSGLLHGFINQTAPHVRQFLGVPYAQPPVESLRFLPPQPLPSSSSSGSINTTAFAPSCIQQLSNSSTIYTEVVPQFLINGGQSEDCLYLNIWAPSLSAEDQTRQELALPVFIYVPGGGFTGGGANSLYKIPDKWIERTQSHIVVVMNYRVNVFGYPNAKGIAEHNPGLLDQRAVVEWTYKNIAAFGGDPNRMTLWGQSAGAASVDYYGYAYYDDPIVSGLIADSGSAFLLNSVDVAQANFTFLASLVGCGELDAELEVACMRNVSAVGLQTALSDYVGSGARPSISFTPFPDNKTAFSNITDRVLNGLGAKIPMILGSNTNEGAGFVSYTPNGPGAAALLSATENIIACPVGKSIKARNLAGLPTYRYQYAGNFSNISPVSWMGAYHSAELPLIFGTHYEYRTPSTPFEYNVSYAMSELYLSFAINSTSGPARWTEEEGYIAWPQYQQNTNSMVLFAEGDTVQQLVGGRGLMGIARVEGCCNTFKKSLKLYKCLN